MELKSFARCRGCGAALLQENERVADGCACNSPRGINHGLVPRSTCTCVICDPEQTGSTRAAGYEAPLQAVVDRAREACRCLCCQGGYPIGGHTLSMGLVGEGGGGDLRPSSCVAHVVLEYLLAERRGR